SAVLTIRLSSMASRIAISSPGSTMSTSRGARNCPFAPADPAPPCPARPDPVPAPPVGSATRPLLLIRRLPVHVRPAPLTYRPASHYDKTVTNRPSSKKRRPWLRLRCETDMDHTAPTPRTDTRSRVQKVALELFAEQGYEKTSLREIAERLGVTKAALYYHFKSKEEIVHAFVEDRLDATTQMIAWVRDQPPGEGTRREFVRRYAELIDTGHASSMASFFQQNQ